MNADEHQLADGNRVPVLGLGLWQVPDGPACINAVRWALRDSGIPRDQVFITTKFHPRGNEPVAQAQQSLRRLAAGQDTGAGAAALGARNAG